MPESASKYSNFIYFPWVLKPIYGLIADFIYPFYYRIKGYVLIIGFFNIIVLILTIGYLEEIDRKDLRSSALYLTVILFWIYLNLSFIDAICRRFGLKTEGMITMTTRLETRISVLKPIRKSKGTYLSHYGFYLITRTIARQVYYFISTFLKSNKSVEGSLRTIKMVLIVLSLATAYIIFHSFFIFKELKVVYNYPPSKRRSSTRRRTSATISKGSGTTSKWKTPTSFFYLVFCALQTLGWGYLSRNGIQSSQTGRSITRE